MFLVKMQQKFLVKEGQKLDNVCVRCGICGVRYGDTSMTVSGRIIDIDIDTRREVHPTNVGGLALQVCAEES